MTESGAGSDTEGVTGGRAYLLFIVPGNGGDGGCNCLSPLSGKLLIIIE